MDKTEAVALKSVGGQLRPMEPHVKPLPWCGLDHVHEAELSSVYDWTPERTDSFLLLLAKGYSVGRITSQPGVEWPSYADYQRKLAQDPEFYKNVKNVAPKRADSLVDYAGMTADSSRPATASSDKLRIDVAFRTAAALDPERYGNKSQVGLTGGLILAAGSLADLAAQAAQLGQQGANREHFRYNSPDAIGQSSDISAIRASDVKEGLSFTSALDPISRGD